LAAVFASPHESKEAEEGGFVTSHGKDKLFSEFGACSSPHLFTQ